MTSPTHAKVERTISGETVNGFPVAAYRETQPEHGDKYGHSYSEHWSTPSNRDPRVKVERLFTESQLLAALEAPHSRTEAIPLPTGRKFIDEEALNRWRETDGKDGHDLVANNNTVWRLVATIDYLRAMQAARPIDQQEAMPTILDYVEPYCAQCCGPCLRKPCGIVVTNDEPVQDDERR